jgi:CRISPR-associated autoregulator DevR family
MGIIQSLSLFAEVTLALHNLNSEGTEGNQQQTRMVHVIDAAGNRHCVNAVSGDMFKHIYVQHLTGILRSQGQPLSTGAASGSPDRITMDPEFKIAIKGRSAAEVQTEMLTRCAVTDVAGTLFTEGITVPRKSCAEVGWVVGIPKDATTSDKLRHFPETPFHSRYRKMRIAPSRRYESYFAVGRSTWSITKISTGPRLGTSFRPSCSCSAAKMSGLSLEESSLAKFRAKLKTPLRPV